GKRKVTSTNHAAFQIVRADQSDGVGLFESTAHQLQTARKNEIIGLNDFGVNAVFRNFRDRAVVVLHLRNQFVSLDEANAGVPSGEFGSDFCRAVVAAIVDKNVFE